MKYLNIPIVDMQEQVQKTLYSMYQIRFSKEAIQFAKNTIGLDQDGSILICAVDTDRTPTYVQTTEKRNLWDFSFLIDIYKKAILSDAVGIFTLCVQKDCPTEIDGQDMKSIYELSRLGQGSGVRFMDHIIMGDEHYISFWESHMLPNTDQLKEINRKPFFVDGPPILGPSTSAGPIA